jgi:predicted NBD/HSP70 family sugar kinase
LSRSSISPEIASLLQQGVIAERGHDHSSGGRRSRLLSPGDPSLAVLAGVDIDTTSVSVLVTGLDGEAVASESRTFAAADDPSATLDLVASLLEGCLASSPGPLLTIGVSISADVDPASSLIASAPTMPKWLGLRIGDYLAERFRVRTFVDNDSNMIALAEANTRSLQGLQPASFLVVKISSGVGCGIVINGEVFRGSGGVAGDIGHICADPADPTLCACGNRGCLEAFAAAPAILREAERLAGDDPRSFIGQLMETGEPLTLERISGAAQAGDPTVARLLRAIGARIGFVLAGIVSFFNPDAVVVRSGIPGGEDILLTAVRQAIYERSLPVETRSLVIEHSRVGRNAEAIGAAILAGQRVLGAPWIVAESRPTVSAARSPAGV